MIATLGATPTSYLFGCVFHLVDLNVFVGWTVGNVYSKLADAPMCWRWDMDDLVGHVEIFAIIKRDVGTNETRLSHARNVTRQTKLLRPVSRVFLTTARPDHEVYKLTVIHSHKYPYDFMPRVVARVHQRVVHVERH